MYYSYYSNSFSHHLSYFHYHFLDFYLQSCINISILNKLLTRNKRNRRKRIQIYETTGVKILSIILHIYWSLQIKNSTIHISIIRNRYNSWYQYHNIISIRFKFYFRIFYLSLEDKFSRLKHAGQDCSLYRSIIKNDSIPANFRRIRDVILSPLPLDRGTLRDTMRRLDLAKTWSCDFCLI